MSLRLETNHLTKKFADFTALEDVSLQFAPGQIHAVLGENGAGKSTLMKLLFGLHLPSAGEIRIDGQVMHWRSAKEAIAAGLGMVQQHFTLVDTLSVIDNIVLGSEICSRFGVINRSAAIAALQELLPTRHLALPWHKLVGQLSVGQKQRLEILKLLFRQTKVLFLDEPTAVLAPTEIAEFFLMLQKLKADGRTIILITHKISEVMQLCDTYCVLRHGRLQVQGNVAGASVEQIVEHMIGRKMPDFQVERAEVKAKTMLRADHVSLAPAARGISLHVQEGEVVGVAGLEGSGQSEFVEALMGLREFAGEMHLNGQKLLPLDSAQVRALGTALIPEDRLAQGLWLDQSCFTNLMIGLEDRFLKHQIFQGKLLKSTVLSWAADFDVRCASLNVPVSALSGGNQQKIIFAREINGRKPRFLVCHQPTRGVDLGAMDLLHHKILVLRNQGLGILILSSELDELLKLCDRIYVFLERQVVAEFKRQDFVRTKIGAAMIGVKNV